MFAWVYRVHAFIDSLKRKEKSVQKIKNFLMAEIKNSVSVLIKKVALRLQKVAVVDSTFVLMVTAVVAAMRLSNMMEEIHLLGLLVTCRFAEKGVAVPDGIAKIFAIEKPMVLPVKEAKPSATQPPTVVAKLAATAPARILVPENGGVFKAWLGFLKGILKGTNSEEVWKGIAGMTEQIFSTRPELSEDQWNLLFSAIKIAKEKGKFIVNNRAAMPVFTNAPVQLVGDYLFGQYGIVPSLTGEITDSGEKTMPSWMQAKASICLDAIAAVDDRKGLGDQEEKLVESLLDAFDRVNAPKWLIEKGQIVWGHTDTSGTATIGEILAAKNCTAATTVN